MNIVNVGYDSTNYYVLAESKPRLLIDAGWPGTWAKFQHQCKRMGIALADIPYVLVTHYHPDHAGLVEELKQAGSKLILIEDQIVAVPQMGKSIKPEDHYTEINVKNNITLKVKDSRAFLAKIGIKGEVVLTPGHSDDSVTLVLDEGAAFTGDLTPLIAASEENAEVLWESWRKIRALGAKMIYAGHGPVRKIEGVSELRGKP
jgi:endoribonuclease LACTB2